MEVHAWECESGSLIRLGNCIQVASDNEIYQQVGSWRAASELSVKAFAHRGQRPLDEIGAGRGNAHFCQQPIPDRAMRYLCGVSGDATKWSTEPMSTNEASPSNAFRKPAGVAADATLPQSEFWDSHGSMQNLGAPCFLQVPGLQAPVLPGSHICPMLGSSPG